MATQINIAELNIETKDVYKKLIDLKTEIASLSDTQKKLKATTGETTAEFIQNEVELKKLSSEYNATKKIAVQLTDAQKAQIDTQTKVNSLINTEVNSINNANRNTKELTALRNSLNIKTKDGADAYDSLNKKINANNEFVKNNSSSQEKLKFNIGGYTKSILDAAKESDVFGKSISSVTNIFNSLQKTTNNAYSSFNDLRTQTNNTTNTLNNLQKTTDNTNSTFKSFVGSVLNFISAGAVALISALGFTIKNTIDLDEAFADISKTTGLTRNQFDGLNRSITNIDTRTPKSELLSLAEVAGKLGISGEQDILGFVKAADKIGVALGKSLGNTEQALTDIGKLVEILGLKDEFGIEKSMLMVGSAINSLGQASTANEAYIVEFAKRFAPIGVQANMSASSILALGATFDQLGLESEMSASAVGRFVQKMASDIPKFAKVANLSISEFSKLLKEDASSALIAVLGKMSKSSGGLEELVLRLNELGITEIREKTAIASLSNSLDVYQDTLKLSAKETKNASSVLDEFAIKNETIGAKISRIWNKIKNIFESSIIDTGIKFVLDGANTVLSNITSQLNLIGMSFDKHLDNAKKVDTITSNSIKKKTEAVNQSIALSEKEIKEKKKDLELELKIIEQKDKNTGDFDKKRLSSENNLAKKVRDIKVEIAKLEADDEKEKNRKILLVELEYSNKIKENKAKNYDFSQKLAKKESDDILKEKKKQADDAVSVAKIELDTYLKKNKSLLDSDKFFSDESLANEILRLQNISTEREKFAKLQLDKGAITQSEYNANILAIDEDFNNQKLENENKRSEAKIAQKAADDQLLFEIQQLSYDDEFQAQSAQLDRQKQAELDNAKSTGASIDLINKKYALMEVELDKQKNAAKLEGYKGLFGGLANLLGQNTELGKAAAIAETTISTYQSAVAAYASAAKIDPIFLAPTMAGLAIASGLANVAKIAETPTPKVEGFADGGIIDLPKMINRSNGDDVIITAKNGEVILNERQQQSIGYGSLALAGVPGFANGGAIGISSSASNSIRRSTSSSSDIVTAIADKINNQQVVAVVDDINLAQFKQVSIVQRASI